VVKLTKALMMHANDLFDLTNSQVMILIETPSGERVWSANGRLRNEFDKEGRILNRSWGMKEVLVESSVNSASLLEDKRPETPPAAQPPPAASPAKSVAASAPMPSSSSSTPFPRDAHEFLQQQQRQLAMPPSSQSRPTPMDQKRELDNQPGEDANGIAAKRARLNQNGAMPLSSQANSNGLAFSQQAVSSGPAQSFNQQSASASYAGNNQSITTIGSGNQPMASMAPNQQSMAPGLQFALDFRSNPPPGLMTPAAPRFQNTMVPVAQPPPMGIPGFPPQLQGANPTIQMQSQTLNQILGAVAPPSARPFPFAPPPMQMQQQQQQISLLPPQQQQQSHSVAYDPSQPTEEPAKPAMRLFTSPGDEKNYVASELDKLHKAGKIRFSWLEIERAFVVIRRDSSGHGDIVKRVASQVDLHSLISDLKN